MSIDEVIVVALADDYGEAGRGPSFEVETFVPVLRHLFPRVLVFPIDRMLRSYGFFEMNRILRATLIERKPALLFCVPFENQLDWQMLREVALSANGPVSLAWMCDDHWRLQPFSRHIAPAFSFVATTDSNAFVSYLGQAGVRPLMTQWGYDPGRFKPLAGEPLHDVSFVGQCRPRRREALQALAKAGVDVHVRGAGWPMGRATTAEVAEIPARSLISLNFADSSVRHVAGSTQLKARVFELAGTGTCVVTEYDPQLDSYLTAGVEVVSFRGPQECVEVVTSLLAQPHRARMIGRAGRETAARQHTYFARFERLLSAASVPFSYREEAGEVCVMS